MLLRWIGRASHEARFLQPLRGLAGDLDAPIVLAAPAQCKSLNDRFLAQAQEHGSLELWGRLRDRTFTGIHTHFIRPIAADKAEE
jgi:hypothetical protein